MPSTSPILIVKLTLGFQDTGFEPVCEHLLAQESSLARTRLFRDLVRRSLEGTLTPYPTPSQEDVRRWMMATDRLQLRLRLNHNDPATRSLFARLEPLPAHTRAHEVRRILFDAMYRSRAPGQSAPAPVPPAANTTPAAPAAPAWSAQAPQPNEAPLARSIRTQPPPAAATDLMAMQPPVSAPPVEPVSTNQPAPPPLVRAAESPQASAPVAQAQTQAEMRRARTLSMLAQFLPKPVTTTQEDEH